MLYVNGTDDILAKINAACAKRSGEFDKDLPLSEWMDLLGEEIVDGLDLIEEGNRGHNAWKVYFERKMILVSAMIVLMIERFCRDDRGEVGDK